MESHSRLIVAHEAARFVALQRTHLQPPLARLLRRWLGKRFFDDFAIGYVLNVARIAHAYSSEVNADYAELADFLPPSATNILDIGCGLAGIDVPLFRHYSRAGGTANLFLMDKTQTDRVIHYGHRPVASFYNDLSVAVRLLRANGVPEKNITTLDAESGQIRAQGVKFDLIVSLLSWAFHYDLTTYLDEALDALTDEGVIILDVRKDSSSADELERRTGLHRTVIADLPKHQRIRLSRGE